MSNTVEIVTKLRDQLTGALQRQGTALSAWQMKVALAAAAAVTAGIAVARATEQFIRFADRITGPLSTIQDMSEGLQVSASDLAALSYVITQAGGEAGNLGPSFQRMRVSISEAADAASPAAEALDALNLSQTSLLAMNPTQQFVEITGALSVYAGTAQQAEYAQALLGRGAVNMRGALNLSRREINDGMVAARELGVVLGDDAYAAADQFQDMLQTVKDRFTALQMEGLQPTLPALQDFLTTIVDLATRVLPDLITSAGHLVSMLGEVVKALEFVADVSSKLNPLQDTIIGMQNRMNLFETSLGPVGLGIMGIRTAIENAGDSSEESAPQVDIFAQALDTVRAAANQAEAELEAYNAELLALEEARQYKKELTYQPGGGASTGGGGSGSPETIAAPELTAEELKLAAATERIDTIKDMEVERIQRMETAEIASLDRIAAKETADAMQTKQARIRAEMEIAAAREASIQRGIDQTVEFGMGMIHAGLEGQEAWDQFWDDFAMRMFDMVMSEAFGMLLQVLTGGGAGFLGSLFGGLFSAGGVVHAASGYVTGAHYGDRVPAMLEPGERVLTRQEARDYSGGGSRGNVSVSLSLGSMFSGASRADLLRAGKILRQVMEAEGLA